MPVSLMETIVGEEINIPGPTENWYVGNGRLKVTFTCGLYNWITSISYITLKIWKKISKLKEIKSFSRSWVLGFPIVILSVYLAPNIVTMNEKTNWSYFKIFQFMPAKQYISVPLYYPSRSDARRKISYLGRKKSVCILDSGPASDLNLLSWASGREHSQIFHNLRAEGRTLVCLQPYRSRVQN